LGFLRYGRHVELRIIGIEPAMSLGIFVSSNARKKSKTRSTKRKRKGKKTDGMKFKTGNLLNGEWKGIPSGDIEIRIDPLYQW
jgi:hypothetical protein